MGFKTYKDVLLEAVLFLEEKEDEAIDINAPLTLIQEKHHWSEQTLLKNEDQVIPAEEEKWLNAQLDKIANYYPVQYILGYTSFYHRQFMVNEKVLIPRKETEWIVDYVLKHEKNKKQTVVDLGCGSGCIGITLKKERSLFDVSLLDISKDALSIAKKNANDLNAEVHFQESDVLSCYQGEKIDIFISNPPYISEAEKGVMSESVKRFEPKEALYAENNGLFIYQKIAKELPTLLSEEGRIYLEIGYGQGEAVKTLMQEAFPAFKVSLLKDQYDNDRLIVVRKEENK